MTWKEVCEDPNLQDLPYKIETNEWGQLILTRRTVLRGAYQARIGNFLSQSMQQQRIGEGVLNAAVQTAKGVKVADVAWFSKDRWQLMKHRYAASVAPEICIEVFSPDTALEAILEKKLLYFDAGAQEVWMCNSSGGMSF